MLERARAKVGESARLLTADMRELPDLGQFDLIWAVNDAVNYLLSVEELEAALTGMRRNLAPAGIALFDVQHAGAPTAAFFSREVVVEGNGRHLVWQGQMSPEEVSPGSISEARFRAEGEERLVHVHRQRHFAEHEMLAAVDAAGLRCIEVVGELDGDLHPGLDEETHTKAVYLCRLP